MHRNHRCLVVLAAALLLAGSSVAAPTLVSYQGQLSSAGVPFDGNAAFKFAVVCNPGLPGASTVWSNDGTSTGGSEPAAAVTMPVSGGLFSALLGDAAAGMVPITADLIGDCIRPALRVWVDTGTGFEQLTDQTLASAPYALQASLAEGAEGTFVISNGTVKVLDAQGATTIFLDGDSGQASVASLRFADNTVQTTAATGGGGSDGDWLVAGNNMSSAVTGNVGVGTPTPDRKFTVFGGTDINGVAGGVVSFADNALESLVFDGNEIQAVDGGNPGGLALNVAGGNVGIGIVNGAATLHVNGSARIDGPAGMAIHNPNNLSAVSRMDWLNDVARFRIGGDGIGALGGFDFQTTSDRSLLRLLHNGNVGIGTATPTAVLDVAGNAVIQGNLTVQGAITGGGGGTQYLSYGPSAFVEENANLMDFNRSTYLYGRTAGQRLNMHVSVNLPHGATITRCEVYCYDAEPTQSNGENIVMVLFQEPLNGGTGTILATQGTQNAPGAATLDSGALSAPVNNSLNFYDLTVYWDTPSPPRAITDMRVYGARITYTAP